MKDRYFIAMAIICGFLIFTAFYAEAEGYRRGYQAGQADNYESQAIYNKGYYAGHGAGWAEGFEKGSGLKGN